MHFDQKRVAAVMSLWASFILVGVCVGFYFR